MPGARTLQLADLEGVPLAGTRWQAIRRPLGVTAFGINAYLAEEAGSRVIEPHDELGSGAGRHEELYLVVSGAATFTVDGERIEAPAGTIVFVPDPASRREAVADAPRTQVLVVGGREGAAMPVAPYETWYAAEGPAQAGDYERAIAIVEEGLTRYPDHPSMLYTLACFHARAGRREAAIGYLRCAYAGDPRTREWAAEDDDLVDVRDAV